MYVHVHTYKFMGWPPHMFVYTYIPAYMYLCILPKHIRSMIQCTHGYISRLDKGSTVPRQCKSRRKRSVNLHKIPFSSPKSFNESVTFTREEAQCTYAMRFQPRNLKFRSIKYYYLSTHLYPLWLTYTHLQ